MRLHLYVTGSASSRSRHAIAIAEALAAHSGGCELDITDVLVEPAVAEEERVMVTPTLDLHTPVSTQRIVGDVDDLTSVAERLGLTIDPDATVDRSADPRADAAREPQTDDT